jgi:hypothetical protein
MEIPVFISRVAHRVFQIGPRPSYKWAREGRVIVTTDCIHCTPTHLEEG